MGGSIAEEKGGGERPFSADRGRGKRAPLQEVIGLLSRAKRGVFLWAIKLEVTNPLGVKRQARPGKKNASGKELKQMPMTEIYADNFGDIHKQVAREPKNR